MAFTPIEVPMTVSASTEAVQTNLRSGIPYVANGITDPVTKSTGDVLQYNGSAWVASDDVTRLKEDIENISGISDDVKTALLNCFAHVAWTDEHGQDYYDALEEALYAEEPKTLVSISAVYTQSGTVYDTDSLNSLKADLVVTATYDDSSTAVVTAYTLSGTLEGGTSTITVTYSEKTTTFTVTVTATVKLTNGTKTFSDNSTLTVNNNHVTVYLATAKANGARFLNISDISGNSSDIFSTTNVNSKSTTFLSLESGDNVSFTAFNASADNTGWQSGTNNYEIASNFRKYNGSTSVLSSAISLFPSDAPMSGQTKVTESTVTQTISENVVASCAFLYIPGGYTAGTTFECDIRIVVE